MQPLWGLPSGNDKWHGIIRKKKKLAEWPPWHVFVRPLWMGCFIHWVNFCVKLCVHDKDLPLWPIYRWFLGREGATYSIYLIVFVVAPNHTSFHSKSDLYLFVDYLQPRCKRTFANKPYNYSLIIAGVGESASPLIDSLFLDTFFQ